MALALADDVRCPHCKRPVAAKVEHPIRGGDWMVRCDPCDIWTVVEIGVVQAAPECAECGKGHLLEDCPAMLEP